MQHKDAVKTVTSSNIADLHHTMYHDVATSLHDANPVNRNLNLAFSSADDMAMEQDSVTGGDPKSPPTCDRSPAGLNIPPPSAPTIPLVGAPPVQPEAWPLPAPLETWR